MTVYGPVKLMLCYLDLSSQLNLLQNELFTLYSLTSLKIYSVKFSGLFNPEVFFKYSEVFNCPAVVRLMTEGIR